MGDYMFNILIVGDMGVGKTSLFGRYLEDRFTRIYSSDLGIEFSVSLVEVAGQILHLQITDAAGGEGFQDMLSTYYRNSHGVIIVYDTTSLGSFRNVSNWLKEVGKFCPKGVNVMLVGSKCDRQGKRQVNQEKATRYAELYGLSFYEASARSGLNVKNIFKSLALECYNSRMPKIVSSPSARSEKVVNKDGMESGQDQWDKDKDKDKDQGKGHGNGEVQF
nr:ras-related protein Rab-13-like [Drosophila kikkawai]